MVGADGENVRESLQFGLSDGSVRAAELHWYEASAIGRKEFKIKRLL
jgi:hypothetical protein